MYILLYSCRKSANNNNGNESTGSDEESTTSETSHKYKDLIKVYLLYCYISLSLFILLCLAGTSHA